ncbi:MAG: CarD family transcriptional regulator [Methylobacteriaceae bacterium]|nr:CarD family transcriptional regulator [Methylobacteriaceae bacterium]
MPSKKNSSKSAKATAGKKTEATKSKRTTAKASTAKAAAKAKTSKVKSVTSASKAKTATAKAAAAKTKAAVAAKAKAAALKAAARKAALAKAAAKAKAAAAARTPAKGASAKPAGKGKAAAVARSAKTSVKTTSAKTTSSKTTGSKTTAAVRAAKPSSAKAAPAGSPAPAKTKLEKNRSAAVVKEATQEKAKQPQIKKAVDNTKTATATHPKPVEQAGARATVQLVRPEAAAPVAPATPAPAPVRAAPDPRPASHAPAVQPRETSEQNPVTQKKTTSPAVAKPSKPAAKIPAPEQKPAKPAGQKLGFKTHEHIVYPAHGVGQIIAIEEQEVAGFKLELFVISFVKDKMILKVPTPKVVSVGMRKLAEAPVITKSLDTLTGRARIKRTMWSRRAQEYEAKINSGDLIAIAEVVRDLYRSEAQPEQSYSERQLYEAALDRMSRELSVVQKITEQESLKLIETQLQKGPRRAAKAEAEAESESGEIDEAA